MIRKDSNLVRHAAHVVVMRGCGRSGSPGSLFLLNFVEIRRTLQRNQHFAAHRAEAKSQLRKQRLDLHTYILAASLQWRSLGAIFAGRLFP